MAKIPGFVYLLIGIFVALVSYFSKNQSLKIFVYIGFVLGVIGIIKLLIGGFQRKKEKPLRQHKVHYQQPKINPKEQARFTKQCIRCGNLVRNFDNFCSRCGTALLHRRR